ncbi:phosphotransferase [Peterkaempfera sp. SMS 1(5)a]|uniref:phosphotransferase n=1 Tax=Peterkaempfera podocarpi TaxID=3232308 RepID=UPI003670FF44
MGESVLHGGFVNRVVRIGDTVRRTPSERSPFVRELLDLFERHGWSGAPRHLGEDEQGRETLTHIDGRAALTPDQVRAAGSDEALARVARLVRGFHDLTAGTPLAGGAEVVCHHDLSPRNTVYDEDWQPRAFIDWDIAAPGERIQDLAHVCWQYLDLGPSVTDVPEAARRIRLICDTYGLHGPAEVMDTVLWWQDRCWRGIQAGAQRGEPAMVGLRDLGVVGEIQAAHRWVSLHRAPLADGR